MKFFPLSWQWETLRRRHIELTGAIRIEDIFKWRGLLYWNVILVLDNLILGCFFWPRDLICLLLTNLESYQLQVIWYQKEKAPAYSYTLLLKRLGRKLALRDPEPTQRQGDLLKLGIVFEIAYVWLFQFSFVDVPLNSPLLLCLDW